MQGVLENNIENFHELCKKDVEGDKQSIYWDGMEASLKEDKFDEKGISDGQSVIEGTEEIIVEGAFSFPIDIAHEKATVVRDEAEHYIVEIDHYVVMVELIDYAEVKAQMEKSVNYEKTTEIPLMNYQTMYFKQYETYCGIITIEDKHYAGYSLILDSGLADKSYRVSVCGTGYLNTIQSEASNIMNHFDVFFE